MRKIIYSSILILLTCCASESKRDKDFIDRLLDLATTTSSTDYKRSEYVQFTNLYDTLAQNIPDDKDEKLILVERLKTRGFKVIHSGRGNFPPLGPRIVVIEVATKQCACEVTKIYYATVTKGKYQMAEGINCKRNN